MAFFFAIWLYRVERKKLGSSCISTDEFWDNFWQVKNLQHASQILRYSQIWPLSSVLLFYYYYFFKIVDKIIIFVLKWTLHTTNYCLLFIFISLCHSLWSLSAFSLSLVALSLYLSSSSSSAKIIHRKSRTKTPKKKN
jgi:hypothetical protein